MRRSCYSSDWPVALHCACCCVRRLQCIGGLCGPALCSDWQLSSLLRPAAGFPASPVLQWLLPGLGYQSCITAGAEKLPPPSLSILYQSWSDWKHSGHSLYYLQSAWALHALMTARGIACRKAWFGDWHASLWTLIGPTAPLKAGNHSWPGLLYQSKEKRCVQVKWLESTKVMSACRWTKFMAVTERPVVTELTVFNRNILHSLLLLNCSKLLLMVFICLVQRQLINTLTAQSLQWSQHGWTL